MDIYEALYTTRAMRRVVIDAMARFLAETRAADPDQPLPSVLPQELRP